MDARVIGVSTAYPERADSDDDVIVEQGSAGVSRARVATAHVQPTRAHHVVRDTHEVIPLLTDLLVHHPNLNVTQLFRETGATCLKDKTQLKIH